MPFKKGKYRQQGKGKLGRYPATCQGTSVVQTAPVSASSASAAADGVDDDCGGSGTSGIDKSGSAEAIAAAVLVLMDPPMKQLTRAEEAAQRGAISSPEFVPHPDCAAAVAKRDAVWAQCLALESSVGQISRGKNNFRPVKRLY